MNHRCRHSFIAKALLDAGDNPDQMHFYPYLAGYVALYTGDYGTAIKELQKADQKDPFVLSLQAQTYEKLGDKAHARDYLREGHDDQSAQSFERVCPATGAGKAGGDECRWNCAAKGSDETSRA